MKLLYNSKDDLLIQKEHLAALPIGEKLGIHHRPYSFSEYVRDIDDALLDNRISVKTEEYAVTKDYQRLFGLLELESNDDDWSMMLGVRASHDQSVSRGIVVGNRVMVCSNLCFSGDLFQGKAKQTLHNQQRILDVIHNAVESITGASERQGEFIHALKNKEMIRNSLPDTILLESFRRGALSSNQLGVAIKEFDNPSFEEHEEHTQTWKLFNALTQAVKPTGRGINMNTVVRKTSIITAIMQETLDQHTFKRGDVCLS